MKPLIRIHDLYVARVVTVMVLATWVVLVGLDALMAGVSEIDAVGQGDYTYFSAITYILQTLPRTATPAEVVACAHCGYELVDPRTGTALNVAFFEGPTSLAGPQVTADPQQYVDDEVVFRQLTCPGCHTAIYSGVVPAAHVDHVLEIDRYVSA